jgi:hypothetical protein
MNRKQRNKKKIRKEQTRLMNKVDKILGLPVKKTVKLKDQVTGKIINEVIIVTKDIDKSTRLKNARTGQNARTVTAKKSPQFRSS